MASETRDLNTVAQTVTPETARRRDNYFIGLSCVQFVDEVNRTSIINELGKVRPHGYGLQPFEWNCHKRFGGKQTFGLRGNDRKTFFQTGGGEFSRAVAPATDQFQARPKGFRFLRSSGTELICPLRQRVQLQRGTDDGRKCVGALAPAAANVRQELRPNSGKRIQQQRQE